MYSVLFVLAMFVPGPLGHPEPAGQATPLRQPGPQPVTRVIRATGVGLPPAHMRGAQARLMARRAAEVGAVRNLAVKLGYGPRATVRGFRYVSTAYRPNGSVEVVVEYPIPRAADSPDRRQTTIHRPMPPGESHRTLISKRKSLTGTSPRRDAKPREVRRLVRIRTRPARPLWP